MTCKLYLIKYSGVGILGALLLYVCFYFNVNGSNMVYVKYIVDFIVSANDVIMYAC